MAAAERHIELWTDSFHEGYWAARSLKTHWKLLDEQYLRGFIPYYRFEAAGCDIGLTVFGSYHSWKPLPKKIAELLSWGKPDLVVYDRDKDAIIFAAEETAAVPTGNQALQRCERLYGANRAGIPFVYLLGEFGLHKDGGIRRDSIFPTLQALKLTLQSGLPTTVLHYGARHRPDSYDEGTGFASLTKTLWLVLRRWLDEAVFDELVAETAVQYRDMLSFVASQWQGMVSFLPGSTLLENERDVSSTAFAARAAGLDVEKVLEPFGNWPRTSELPPSVRERQPKIGFLVADAFLKRVVHLVDSGRAYTVVEGEGSKPLPEPTLVAAIADQKKLFDEDASMRPEWFSLVLSSFPPSKGGRHVVTSTRILFLIDRLGDVVSALHDAFPASHAHQFDGFDFDQPVVLFVCNSITPKRSFGDPYTGQIAAYVPIFARDAYGTKSRVTIAYYPHQVQAQWTAKSSGNSKGARIIRELIDYAIFHGGVTVPIAVAQHG